MPLSEEQLRADLARAFEALTSDEGLGDGDELAAGRSYLRAMLDGGWAVPAWPQQHGGRGASKAEAATIARLTRSFPVPDLYPFFVGLRLAGPSLLIHGSEDQKGRWLRSIASGVDVWCQMFSEPEAGSDLANVATRAVRRDGGWSITGQKIWTSRGSYATWGLCLARTDPMVPKHDGLTMFAVRMDSPGVDVRPLVQMNGDRHFSEVFIDDVLVRDEDRIGAEGEGWRVALTVLAHERQSIGSRPTSRRTGERRLPHWLLDVAKTGALEDPVKRDRAIQLYIRAEVARLTSARAAALARSGRPGPEGSGHKLRMASLFKDRAYFVKECHGPAGMLTEHPGHDDTLTAPSMSIRGGTDEIQRNIVAERVLGLPAEPRLDRDVPWSKARVGVGP